MARRRRDDDEYDDVPADAGVQNVQYPRNLFAPDQPARGMHVSGDGTPCPTALSGSRCSPRLTLPGRVHLI